MRGTRLHASLHRPNTRARAPVVQHGGLRQPGKAGCTSQANCESTKTVELSLQTKRAFSAQLSRLALRGRTIASQPRGLSLDPEFSIAVGVPSAIRGRRLRQHDRPSMSSERQSRRRVRSRRAEDGADRAAVRAAIGGLGCQRRIRRAKQGEACHYQFHDNLFQSLSPVGD